MRVACCQIAPDVTRPDASVEMATEAIEAAVASGAEIVVLPELANSGYVFCSAEEARSAAAPAEGPLLDGWARAAGDAVLIVGFCELGEDGAILNSAALLDRGGVIAVYRKLHLWDDERRWFTPGEEAAPVLETRRGRIGLAICYDLEFPEVARGLALQGAELIAIPTNWPVEPRPPDGRPILHSLAAVTAYLNKVFVAVCDRCGAERGLEFQGGSVLAGPTGELLAGPVPDRGRQTLFADLELELAREKGTGTSNDAFADRRPAHYAPSMLYPEEQETVR